jgi:hypothetical protein
LTRFRARIRVRIDCLSRGGDYDSGVAGNAWANDTINRHRQVFDQGGGNYCAVVNDTGQIVTFAGESPRGTGTIAAGSKGNLGNVDLMCVDAYTCPGAHPSYLSDFSSTTGDDLAEWGWS